MLVSLGCPAQEKPVPFKTAIIQVLEHKAILYEAQSQIWAALSNFLWLFEPHECFWQL